MAATDGAKRALENYLRREARKSLRQSRRNKKPEKQVEEDCMAWMKSMLWDVGIYEAKGVYNPFAGRYVSQRMKAGTVDCQGIMPDGTAVAIEFKAPGRLSTFNRPGNHRQKEFLLQKINYNAFGCVVDTALSLKQLYETWAKITDVNKRREFLIESLPSNEKNPSD